LRLERIDGVVFNVSRGPREESVGVWSFYCRDEMGPLVIIKGGQMTARRYLEMLKMHFILFY